MEKKKKKKKKKHWTYYHLLLVNYIFGHTCPICMDNDAPTALLIPAHVQGSPTSPSLGFHTRPGVVSPTEASAGPDSSSPQPCPAPPWLSPCWAYSLASAQLCPQEGAWGCPSAPSLPAAGWGDGTGPDCQALPGCPEGGPSPQGCWPSQRNDSFPSFPKITNLIHYNN